MLSKIKTNKLFHESLISKRFCIKKANIKSHIKTMNLPNSKLLSKEEIRLEFLKLGKF